MTTPPAQSHRFSTAWRQGQSRFWPIPVLRCRCVSRRGYQLPQPPSMLSSNGPPAPSSRMRPTQSSATGLCECSMCLPPTPSWTSPWRPHCWGASAATSANTLPRASGCLYVCLNGKQQVIQSGGRFHVVSAPAASSPRFEAQSLTAASAWKGSAAPACAYRQAACSVLIRHEMSMHGLGYWCRFLTWLGPLAAVCI